jgi:conjugal transfer pilus assembly protein TraB
VSVQNTVKQRWSALPSSKKRLYILSLAGALFLVFCMIIAQGRDNGPIKQVSPSQKYQLINPDMAKEVLAEKLTRDIADLRSEMRTLHDENRKLREELANTPGPGTPASPDGAIGTSTAHEREMGLRQQLQGLGALPVQKGGDIFPPIPAQPKVPGAATPPPITQPSSLTQSVVLPPAAPPGQTVVMPPQSLGQPPKVSVAEPRVMGALRFNTARASTPGTSPSGPADSGDGSVSGDGSGKAVKDETSRHYNFYMPSASHFRVRLLTGLDAPTGPKASSQPHPVILRVQDLSFLPNNVRQNISGCHLLGEAIGELSSERARIRGLNLSCVDEHDDKVIDESIEGFVADSDGKASLRGRVVSKQGRFLANALLAAFAEGVGKGFSSFGTITSVGAYGATQTSDMDNFSDGFKQGVGSGLSQAASKLSEFYLKAAEDLYPVIEITTNREVTFITTKGKRFQADKKMFLPVASVDDKDAGKRDDNL